MSDPVREEPMPGQDRTCLACKHFDIHEAEGGYSDMTPGSDFSMECYRDVWTFNSYETSTRQFRLMLLTARTCKKFDPVPAEVSPDAE